MMLYELIGLLLSIAVFVLPIVLIWKKHYSRWYFGALLYIFAWVLLVKNLVGYLGVWNDGDSISNLKGLEIFVDSFVHVLRSFSLDEDYTAYTAAGKKLLMEHKLVRTAAVLGIMNSFLNILAPLLGGTVLLEILSNIFPKMQLAFKSFRPKFVFSELNDASITLAEDLYENRNGITARIMKKKDFRNPFSSGAPMIVFTDIYIDRESERNSELVERAKAIRAICVDSDLNHLKLYRSKHVYYFLMDTESQENVREVAFLLSDKGQKLWPAAKKDGSAAATEMYVFLDSDKKCDLTLKYYGKYCEKAKDEAAKKAVMLRPIRDYMNACFNLLYDVPLFLPLLETSDRENTDEEDGIRSLTITIIGGGSIAEEAFKAVYWCGQIQGVRLHVNVLSNNAYGFRKRIENNYPELLESCRSGSLLLKVSPDTDSREFNEPYIRELLFSYIRDASVLPDYPERILEETDYYIIAVGNDDKALDITSRIRLYLEQRSTKVPAVRRRVIAPAVFLPEIAEGMKNVRPAAYEPYVIPFAALTQRFNCENVFMERLVARDYSSDQGEHFYGPADLKSETQDSYQYWAKIARRVHAPYKAFGMGMIENVDICGSRAVYTIRNVKDVRDMEEKKKEISWIEHRRWNAFMRVQGFRSATREQMERFWEDCGEHKDLRRKLHICMVESREGTTAIASDPKDFDCLDAASLLVRNKRPDKKNHDFKKYDAFGYDDALMEFLKYPSQK